MKISQLKPLSNTPLQVYLGIGIHTLGLLGWILKQVGRADVYVTTFSTSEEFLTGFLNLRKKGLIRYSMLLADLKAAKKTVKLNHLMSCCFDDVYLGLNHSKILLVKTESGKTVSVITSQNNTYGGRNECSLVTTDPDVFHDLYGGLKEIIKNSVLLDGLFGQTTERDRESGSGTDSTFGDIRPFGY
jgi:hypothetical protein